MGLNWLLDYTTRAEFCTHLRPFRAEILDIPVIFCLVGWTLQTLLQPLKYCSLEAANNRFDVNQLYAMLI